MAKKTRKVSSTVVKAFKDVVAFLKDFDDFSSSDDEEGRGARKKRRSRADSVKEEEKPVIEVVKKEPVDVSSDTDDDDEPVVGMTRSAGRRRRIIKISDDSDAEGDSDGEVIVVAPTLAAQVARRKPGLIEVTRSRRFADGHAKANATILAHALLTKPRPHAKSNQRTSTAQNIHLIISKHYNYHISLQEVDGALTEFSDSYFMKVGGQNGSTSKTRWRATAKAVEELRIILPEGTGLVG